MCFSNLPIEFDDEGNPYLAEEAEDVDTPGDVDGSASGGDGACGCSAEAGEVALEEADPEATYEAIVDSMPGDVREQVAGTKEAQPLDEPLEESLDDRVGERDGECDRPDAAEGD